MSRRIGIVAATTVTGVLLAAGAANASVTFDPTCSLTPNNGTGACGFVGKGDVQTALGLNNDKMQKAVNNHSLAFTYSQSATQSLSQSATQSGTQAGTQSGTQTGTQTVTETGSASLSETKSCDGLDGQTHFFHREGTRTGTRTGTREGTRTATRSATRTASRTATRTGSRTGTATGNVSYTIAYDPRLKNQYTGFLLTSVTPSGFVPVGDPTWSEWSFDPWAGSGAWGSFGAWGDFGTYNFTGGYTYGDVTGTDAWGKWDTDPSEDPHVCDSGNPNIYPETIKDDVTVGEFSDESSDLAVTNGEIAAGEITPGAFTPGDISYGDVTYGDPVASGPAHLYVNGIALN